MIAVNQLAIQGKNGHDKIKLFDTKNSLLAPRHEKNLQIDQ